MQTVMGIENFHDKSKPIYLALGNFDGVHKGHQSLIQALIRKAKVNGGQALAFIFEPHPAQVLMPERAPRLLQTPQGKADLLEKIGLDLLIYNPFTSEIAAWSPEQFVEKILIGVLQISEVFIGFNYTFGHRGAGTPDYLKQLGDKLGFGVNIIAPVTYEGEPISSSLVRKALEVGDILTAYNMLGYHPVIEGVVVEGEHRGAQIGFPTANVGVETMYNIPGKGVYAAHAWIGSKVYHGVVNIGSKPTFHQEYPLSIEAHLIDFTGDIYGQNIRLSFLEKLREEQRFQSLEELVSQIARDRDRAEEICRAYDGDL
ncbi:MAG: bifunctional riboflavin kinase/FAD synthetase [Firmicutes bacterium HGW-Firmicutes-15]|nr:MAG: bifunctional riboflavin kinase/FAD synthetase [Firmicutes bacterium HGW-Firmicutes-15]